MTLARRPQQSALRAIRDEQATRRGYRVDICDWAAKHFYIAGTKLPIQLLLHQKAVLRYLLLRDDDDVLRWTTAIYSSIKKSGKSTIGALVGRFVAETQTRMGEIYCLHRDAKVVLADGQRKLIRDIVRERDRGPVATLVAGEVQARPVTGWYESQLGDGRWVGLRYRSARCTGPGGLRQRVLWLTDDHLVATPDGWRRAGDIQTGETVVTDEVAPSPEQEEIIVGTLLGDGFLVKRPGTRTRASLRLSHCLRQAEWLQLKRDALATLGFGDIKPSGPRNVLSMTSTSGYLTQLHGRWYRDGKKKVDRLSVERCFSLRLLTTWFLDDGSTVRSPYTWLVRFATNGFAQEDAEWLARHLSAAGYDSYVRQSKGPVIYMRAEASRRFLQEIAPYVPPSMRYKLPAAVPPFGPELWRLPGGGQFLDTVEVVDAGSPAVTHAYCLDVEDGHNFFASGLLVHNCIGNDWRQAKGRSFRFIEESIRLTPGIRRYSGDWVLPDRWRVQKTKHECYTTGSRVEAISVDAAGEAGASPDLSVWTELWGSETVEARRFWEEMTPVATKPNSMRLVETYAGYDGESELLQELYDMGKQGRQLTNHELAEVAARPDVPGETYEDFLHAFGELNGDPEAFVPVWVDEGASLFMYWDEDLEARRMPWQRGPKGDAYYAEEERTLPPPAYRRMHLNKWSAAEGEFIPMPLWDACKEHLPAFLPEGKEPVVLSLDAAVSGDCFGITAATRHPGVIDEAGQLIPGSARHEDPAIRAVRKWTPPKGGVIEFAGPEEFIRVVCRGGCIAGHYWKRDDCPACQEGRRSAPYNVVQVTYDPFQLEDMAQRLRKGEDEGGIGIWMHPFDQGALRLKADRQLFDLVVNKRLAHDGNEELREHVQNSAARVEKDQDSKLRIVKKAKNRKIDLLVAASMGVHQILYLTL